MISVVFRCDWCLGSTSQEPQETLVDPGLPDGWVFGHLKWQLKRRPTAEGVEPEEKRLTFCCPGHMEAFSEAVVAADKSAWFNWSREFERQKGCWDREQHKAAREGT